jgi:uncharacterized membrane protein
MNGRVMIGLGFVLVMTGAVLPFLMVVHAIQPTFPLLFFSFGATVAGLGLGLVATVFFARRRNRRE